MKNAMMERDMKTSPVAMKGNQKDSVPIAHRNVSASVRVLNQHV
jgi:hypothetical protein